MTDELALRKQMEEGSQARRVLDDPAITKAFDLLQAEYYEAWKASASHEMDARERLWTAATIIGKVRSHLEQAVSDGKIAHAEIEALTRATPG